MIKLHKNQSGVIHHLALIILAVVVITGVGFTGYKVYQAKYGVKAKAERWSIIAGSSQSGYSRVYACKVIFSGGVVVRFKPYYVGGGQGTWSGSVFDTAKYPKIIFQTGMQLTSQGPSSSVINSKLLKDVGKVYGSISKDSTSTYFHYGNASIGSITEC